MLELKGKAVADFHKEMLREKVAAVVEQGIHITMGIVLVGEDMASQMYASFMQKTAKAMGFEATTFSLPETASQEEVEDLVKRLNADKSIHGILPMMPMPKHIDVEAVLDLMSPLKDLDGLTTKNAGLIVAGKKGFAPCTPRACMAILDYYHIPVEGREVAIIGRSNVVGKPLASLLLARNATVTICHSKTEDLPAVVRRADIVIVAIGKAEFVKAHMIKDGAVVIDVGINELDGKTVGDVDYDEVAQKTSAITPVPGGVGSVTTTMMLEALWEAYHA